MKLYFDISEFNISGDPIPEDVCDKILRHHILVINSVREQFGQPIFVSKKSGYRPLNWERKNGRNGNSQHVFKGKGAADWTCEAFQKNKARLLNLIIRMTPYTRIAIYGSFIHTDYKGEKRALFRASQRGWHPLKL